MSTGAWATLALATACLASFSWAMQRFFVRPPGANPGVRVVAVIGACGALAHVVALTVAPTASAGRRAAAVVLYAASLALFSWSIRTLRRTPLSIIFAADTPAHLVTDGPYRRIRHPLYTAYSLTWLAGPLAADAPWLVPMIAAMLVLYARAARAEERKFVSSPLAACYAAYAKRTGRFVPRLGCVTDCPVPPGARCDAPIRSLAFGQGNPESGSDTEKSRSPPDT